MKKRTKWILIIILVLVISGIVGAIFLRPEKKSQYSTEAARRGELAETVSVSGTAQSKKMIELSPQSAAVAEKIRVKIGDSVKKGETLIELDSRGQALRLEQAQANLNLAQSNLAMARENDLEAAETALKNAEQTYQDLKTKNKRALAEAEIDLAEAENYTLTYQDYFNSIEESYDNGETSEASRNLVRASLTNIQAQERAARETLKTLEITTKQTEGEAWYDKEKARQSLERQKALAENWAKSNLLQQVDYNRVSLELAALDLEKTILKSPQDGIVSKISAEEGENLAAFASAVTVIAAEREISASVPESEINKIKLDQEAEITFDAAPDEIFKGKVALIEPAETVIEGVTYYKVRIVFDDPDFMIKSGMSADINIKIATRENVLSIPQRAVKERDGKKYAEVKEGEILRETEVVTGMKGDGARVEILSGLKEGEEVVTFVKK